MCKQVNDPRLRRLRLVAHSPPRRAEHKPEIIDEEPEHESESSAEEAKDSSESEDELDEDEIERRRQALRAKLAARYVQQYPGFGSLSSYNKSFFLFKILIVLKNGVITSCYKLGL